MAQAKTKSIAASAQELEAMHAVYRKGGEEQGVAPHVVYTSPTCPHPGCAQPMQAIDFRLEAHGRAIHDPLVRAWWSDTGFAGRCPQCGGWIHFTIRGKRAITAADAEHLPQLPDQWHAAAIILKEGLLAREAWGTGGARMKPRGANDVGRFAVEFQVANHVDVLNAQQGLLEPDKVRRLTIPGVVDCGATRLVLPERVVKQLGLPSKGKVKVRYANNQTATRDAVKEVHVDLLGRDGVFTAVVEPKRRTALIGAIVLEDLDFVVDCTQQRLVPRDPRFIVSEIE